MGKMEIKIKREFLPNGFWSLNGNPTSNLRVIFVLLFKFKNDVTISDLTKNNAELSKQITTHLVSVNPKIWKQKSFENMCTSIQQQLVLGLSNATHINVEIIHAYYMNQCVAKEAKKEAIYY